jgi:urease accessory protein
LGYGNGQELLHLLHLADTALPVGALAHSYGIETLTATGLLDVEHLDTFLPPYIQEVGGLEVIACRLAWRLANSDDQLEVAQEWRELNQRLSAFKMVREGRTASITLGRRLLYLAHDLDANPIIETAVDAMRDASVEAHYCAAFGLVASSFSVTEEATALSYLRQMLANIVSCCQRLLPLGQGRAGRILWRLYPSLIDVAAQSEVSVISLADMAQFAPTLDVASMLHPRLVTRLFIS